MADNTAKFTFKADGSQAIRESDKVGESFKRTGKKAKTIGEEVGKAITKVEILQRAARAAASAMGALADKAEEVNRKSGQNKLSLAGSLASLGVSDINGAVQRAQSAPGGVSLQDIEGFASSLAEQQAGTRGPKLSPGDAERAIGAFSAGGGALSFGAGGRELLSGIERGMSLDQSIAEPVSRRPGLRNLASDPNSSIARELALRGTERSGELDVAEKMRRRGELVRAGKTEQESMLANNPMLASLLSILPTGIMSGVAQGQGSTSTIMAELERQTELMQNRPTLAPGANQ